MKQETTKEAAEKLYPTDCSNWSIKVPLDERKAFIEGVEWQQERSYSEEEVKNMINDYDASQILFNEKYTYNEWFKQFKKK